MPSGQGLGMNRAEGELSRLVMTARFHSLASVGYAVCGFRWYFAHAPWLIGGMST